MAEEEIQRLAEQCKNRLNLCDATLGDEYYYQSLPLCVIDAVFSIGIRYTTTRGIVRKFCTAAGWKQFRKHGSDYPPVEEQDSIDNLLALYKGRDFNQISAMYFSRHRTSSSGGILKTEAVKGFCEALRKCGINFYQDLPDKMEDQGLEHSIKAIKGQGSGLSLDYFYMLAGNEGLVKPDRMVIRFVESSIGRGTTSNEASDLVIQACDLLKKDFPTLTPRLLDFEIWNFQKDR
ncbi:MAG: hypothetical protein HY280_02610 [Nitrospinae bacterium]|nr:hypothetical protein [Nitrospinota bacterium]